MPEGDTVYRAARSMHRALAGRILTATDFRVPRHATADLTGRSVTEVVARGKHLLARTHAGITVHSHFKMEGTWHLYRPGSRWRGGPEHEIRAVLETREWVAVGYRLGILELLSTDQEQRAIGHLGPDLLGPGWDPVRAAANLRRRPERPVAEALLDQTNLAGIGNLYKAETLHVAGVNPWAQVGEVPDLFRLIESAHRLLDLGKEHWVQSTTGSTERAQAHWVFERTGKPCRRCGTLIKSASQGPPNAARITYWCPTCQPQPQAAQLR
ncbi:MAG: Fpg/Nei family DNA glycosylase [Actinomycetota bacterium]